MVPASDTSQPRLTRKGQATRDRIVAAAAQLTFERGVAATTPEAVKATAGVSSSQMYHYFAGKQDLIHAVIGHQVDAALGAQQPLLEQVDSIQALRAWRDHTVALAKRSGCRGGCPVGAFAGQLAETDADARSALAAGFGRWEAAIGDGLRAMHRRGDLVASADPDGLALALLAAVQGGLLLAQVRRDAAPLEAAIDAMLDHIESLTPQQ
jgi:AcrR family transcriptional regulator